MQDHFELQQVPDGSRGERFIIHIEGVGRFTECSKPLTESDARRVLHKMGHPAAVIESMVDRAKAAQPNSDNFRLATASILEDRVPDSTLGDG